MKKRLNPQFVYSYIFIGLFGLVALLYIGSSALEHYLESTISKQMYSFASSLSSSSVLCEQANIENFQMLYNMVSHSSPRGDMQIWIADSKGQVLLNSADSSVSITSPLVISEFSPKEWGNSYYKIGTFHDFFSDETLSVMSTITNDKQVMGYVLIHVSVSTIYEERDSIFSYFLLVYIFLFVLFWGILLRFFRKIDNSLHIIADGASALADGKLSYDIPVNSNDTIGYLAQTLNYVNDKNTKDKEYQNAVISNISHDFRSPLTSIKGYVEAMIDGTIPVEMQEKYLQIISHEADRLVKLTQGIISLRNVESHGNITMTDFDINETIRIIAATFEGACNKKNLQISLVFNSKSLFVHADAEQIQQVLYNLIDNAIKFSNENSEIIVSTTENNGKIFVSVRDFGIGIKKENLSKIWNRFYKIDSSRGKDPKGTGLGLTIAKDIINNHGQNIDVISTEGVGTEFAFTLNAKSSS